MTRSFRGVGRWAVVYWIMVGRGRLTAVWGRQQPANRIPTAFLSGDHAAPRRDTNTSPTTTTTTCTIITQRRSTTTTTTTVVVSSWHPRMDRRQQLGRMDFWSHLGRFPDGWIVPVWPAYSTALMMSLGAPEEEEMMEGDDSWTAPYIKELPLDGTYSARFLEDNGLTLTTDDRGRVTARPQGWSSDHHHLSDDSPHHDQLPSQEVSSSAILRPLKTKTASSPTATQGGPPADKGLSFGPTDRLMKPAGNYKPALTEQHPTVVPLTGFNVVLTHATADFDSLAAAVALAKLWATEDGQSSRGRTTDVAAEDPSSVPFDSFSHVPTFVVLPRGAHPSVQRFLALHKYLFPIRSLKSLPQDLSGLHRLALCDAQRRDRLGPAEHLLKHARRITVVDHHVDQDSDIPAHDYVVDKVGSVTTLMVERLMQRQQQLLLLQKTPRPQEFPSRSTGTAPAFQLSEAEATLLALGIHSDTGSLCFDSTTPRDAMALAWCMNQGASQAAIAELARSSLSPEQQAVLTQTLIHSNATVVHGVTVSTVLLSADDFIHGLAAVTQDALELSSSDIFILGLVYQAHAGSGGGGGGGGRNPKGKPAGSSTALLTSRLLSKDVAGRSNNTALLDTLHSGESASVAAQSNQNAAWRRRLRASFDAKDRDGSGYLDIKEVSAALATSGVIASAESVAHLMATMDRDGNGRVDFEEFFHFARDAEHRREEHSQRLGRKGGVTMIIIGRVKAGVSLKNVKLNRLLEQFGGGGHAKAASATIRLNDESEAESIMQGLVDELIETSLQEQPTAGDFMTSPVLSVQPTMTVKQVEDLFLRYDVRALPVVDDHHDVVGLVTYKEVAAAKQRMWNKEQKRLEREREAAERGEPPPAAWVDERVARERQQGTTVKGWMLQHIQTVEASKTMAEVESMLIDADVGCIPVVADGTRQLVGMVTRTDLLRQHRYYNSLHYHNKGFADSIAARKPIIELRKRLKQFDLD